MINNTNTRCYVVDLIICKDYSIVYIISYNKAGTKSRVRLCDSPAPEEDGKPCIGDDFQNIPCNEDYHCPG